MTTTLSETNTAIMTLIKHLFLLPDPQDWLLDILPVHMQRKLPEISCFPVSSEHLITRKGLKRLSSENITLYNQNVSRSKLKLCGLNHSSKLQRQIFGS